jgi:hypothetical protein
MLVKVTKHGGGRAWKVGREEKGVGWEDVES